MPQSELELPPETSESQPDPTPDPPAKRDNAIGISDKNVDNLNMSFSNSVRNDNVGNLRMAKHSDSDKFIYYAKSYVDKYFENDKEIHGIINFTYKTTTAVRKYDDMLDITIHEYVSKEEHDARKLFGGMVLQHYFVYLDNGDIEKVQ